MDSSSKVWLRDVGVGMLNARLPLSYVTRAINELHAHLHDAMDATDEAEAPTSGDLGISANQLVEQFEVAYRNSNLRSRVPFAVWLIAVPPLTIVVCLIYFGAMAIAIEAIDMPRAHPELARPLTWLFYCGKLITPVIAFYLLAWCIKPLRISSLKYAIIMMSLAAFFAVTVSRFHFPTETLGGELTLHLDDEVLAQANLVWQLSQGGMVIFLSATKYLRDGIRRHDLYRRFA